MSLAENKLKIAGVDVATEVNAKVNSTELAKVAISGSYNDLKDKPSGGSVSGDYLPLSGGYNGTYLSTVDCYNSNLAKVDLDDLSIGRQELEGASIGNYAIFAGGANKAGNQGLIDIYECK